MRLVWTGPTLDDLAQARAWIAQDRPITAERQVGLVTRAVERLVEHPHRGRRGRRSGTRELVIPGPRS
ncbi:MAG: type II toxin-antitoxin system RelE/ParE family toxin [Caulobacteraceae bacterium]